MNLKLLTSAAIALGLAVAGIAGAGSATAIQPTGPHTITVGDDAVKVMCSGGSDESEPTIFLLHGGGDDLTAMTAFQETLATDHRVCSYDRLGAGGSDKPDGPQGYDDIGRTLTGVLDQLVGDRPVVLVGHSMGGLIAARYAPDHQDRVRGLVLLDSTSPTAVTDLSNRIPETATGTAGALREQTLAIFAGENPERLMFTDGEVRTVGNIPVRIMQHGERYLAEVPDYGQGLEKDWTKGQKKWMALSSNSNRSVAKNSGHYIYLEAPEAAVRAVNRVVSQATR